jgi:hypothetical protein
MLPVSGFAIISFRFCNNQEIFDINNNQVINMLGICLQIMALAIFLPFSEIANGKVVSNKPVTKLFAHIPTSIPGVMCGGITVIEVFLANLVT